MARRYPVNQHCLLHALERAISAGQEFSRKESGGEPADNFLVEVPEKP